jgi:hypothetical protein
MTDTRQTLTQELKEARQMMLKLLKTLESHTAIYPEWTTKELLAHITGWDEAVIVALKTHFVGETPAIVAPRGIDHYNAETVSTRETLSYDHIYREWVATRGQLLGLISEAKEENFVGDMTYPWGQTGPVTGIIQVLIHHEKSHVTEISEALK